MTARLKFFFDFPSPYSYLASTQLGGLVVETELREWANAAEIDARLEADMAEAFERGVFGVPTLFVEGEMFFGNDRLDFVRRRLAAPEGEAA